MKSIRANSYTDSSDIVSSRDLRNFSRMLISPETQIQNTRLPKLRKSTRSKTPNGRERGSRDQKEKDKYDIRPLTIIDLHINVMKYQENLNFQKLHHHQNQESWKTLINSMNKLSGVTEKQKSTSKK